MPAIPFVLSGIPSILQALEESDDDSTQLPGWCWAIPAIILVVGVAVGVLTRKCIGRKTRPLKKGHSSPYAAPIPSIVEPSENAYRARPTNRGRDLPGIWIVEPPRHIYRARITSRRTDLTGTSSLVRDILHARDAARRNTNSPPSNLAQTLVSRNLSTTTTLYNPTTRPASAHTVNTGELNRRDRQPGQVKVVEPAAATANASRRNKDGELPPYSQ